MALGTRANNSNLDLVSSITCLTSKRNHEEAMKILRRVATMVRPMMIAHSWKIGTLAEFYTAGLLGMNTNRGWKIQLCLRVHGDDDTFLPWEDIMGTMLHELAHNLRGPHDEKFYKALSVLNEEYDKIVDSGYTGQGFDAAGHRLGTKMGRGGVAGSGGSWGTAIGSGSTLGGGTIANGGLVSSGARAAAVLAAEKRRQTNEMMLPTGGVRLGGRRPQGKGDTAPPKNFWEQWHSAGELAVMAAERRAKDQVWCGSSQPASASSLSTSRSLSSSSSSTPVTTASLSLPAPSKNTQTAMDPTLFAQRGKRKVGEVVDLTKEEDDKKARAHSPPEPVITIPDVDHNVWSAWSCPACTFDNRPLALQCECCMIQRPLS